MSPESYLVMELIKNGTYLLRQGNLITMEFGLSQQQFVVLKAIQENQPVSPKDVASAFVLKKSNISKSIRKFKEMGLARSAASEKDGRVMLVSLTPKGEDLVARAMEKFEKSNQEWLEGVATDEIKRMAAFLGSLPTGD